MNKSQMPISAIEKLLKTLRDEYLAFTPVPLEKPVSSGPGIEHSGNSMSRNLINGRSTAQYFRAEFAQLSTRWKAMKARGNQVVTHTLAPSIVAPIFLSSAFRDNLNDPKPGLPRYSIAIFIGITVVAIAGMCLWERFKGIANAFMEWNPFRRAADGERINPDT